MNYNGTIKLLFGGMIIHDVVYSSREERNDIVEMWKRSYMKSFEVFHVLIAPNCICDIQDLRKPAKEVSDSKFYKLREKAEERNRKPFVRPKAVYNNRRPYDLNEDTYSFPGSS